MKLLGVLAALLLTVGAAVALGSAGDDDHPAAPVALGHVRLISVESCDELLDWYRTVAAQTDAQFLGGYGTDVMYATEDKAATTSGAPLASGAATGGAAADQAANGTRESANDSFSGTNVQERDVDEPDTVKTNGKILINASYDKLEIVDVTGDQPKLVSTVPVEQGGTEILLSGDRVLALTNVWRQDPNAPQAVAEGDQRVMMMPIQGKQVTVLQSIDVSDPANPRTVEKREIEGSYRTARVTGTTARIVIVSYPQLPQPGPAVYDNPSQTVVEQRLQEWKREAIASMTLQDWAPVAQGDCSSVARTSQPEGLGTTSVLTIDAQGSLATIDTDSVVADAGTVYASTDRLFIATSRWSQQSEPDGQVTTELHGFDISSAETSYVGSGSVKGYLLNQFAVSAKDGYLRVATTQEAPWSPETESQPTHSGISVLDERDGALVEVGHLDGLGVTERIQAVRYIGDTAYVVTFRQKDPLFAIDLSNPTAPRVAGELKIPGYSAYLHPIDDGRLLGVGQDATDDGQVLGTQIATFDVRDQAAPTRIASARIDHGTSPVEYDHRAFLWWPATRTVVIPVEIYDPGVAVSSGVVEPSCPPDALCAEPAPAPDVKPGPESRPFMGAVAFGIGDDGSIVEHGRVSHDGRGTQPDGYFPVMRSIVIGDSLYTISEAGVLKSDLSSLADQGYAQFPTPNYDGQPIPVEGDAGASTGGAVAPEPAVATDG